MGTCICMVEAFLQGGDEQPEPVSLPICISPKMGKNKRERISVTTESR